MEDEFPKLPNIFRIDQEATPGGKGATHGWQVRIQRDNKHHSSFFGDVKFGGKKEAVEEAIKFRNKAYESLGEYTADHGGLPVISDRLAVNNNTGIRGVNRTEGLLKSANIYEAWQTSYPTIEFGYVGRKFSINRFGELGALILAIQNRLEGISSLIGSPKYQSSQDAIKRSVDHYLNILIYLESISKTEENFLLTTIKNKTIPSTTKEEIINGRIGQIAFKDKLLKLYNGKCQITGSTLFLNASHIKPWAKSSPEEKIDPFNGFLLSPLYDRAFDNGFLTFTDDGESVLSQSLLQNREILSIPATIRIQNLSPFSIKYLSFHRETIFNEKH